MLAPFQCCMHSHLKNLDFNFVSINMQTMRSLFITVQLCNNSWSPCYPILIHFNSSLCVIPDLIEVPSRKDLATLARVLRLSMHQRHESCISSEYSFKGTLRRMSTARQEYNAWRQSITPSSNLSFLSGVKLFTFFVLTEAFHDSLILFMWMSPLYSWNTIWYRWKANYFCTSYFLVHILNASSAATYASIGR